MKILHLILLVSLSFSAFAQNNPQEELCSTCYVDKLNGETVYEIVEESAKPEGGYSAFYKYIKKNLIIPKQGKRMGVDSKIYLCFIVDTQGNSQNVCAYLGSEIKLPEMEKLVQQYTWSPAKQRGKNVPQRVFLPIHIRLN